jgi:ABC-type Fe3+-hydroxamate transport system substrate-binding protein
VKQTNGTYAVRMRGVVFFVGVLLCAAGAIVIFFAAYQPRNTKPIETQQHAEPTRLRRADQRLAVLSPALAVIVRDLGLASRVVARHAYDDVLPKELPAVGDQAGIDYEALLRAQPTHVLVQWGARELPDRLLSLAHEQGWQLINSNPLNMAEIAQAVQTIDASLGAIDDPAPTDDAAALLEQLRTLRTTTPHAQAGTTLLLASTNPPAALGPGSCHHELLVALGGTPTITTGTPWMELSHEDLVQYAPHAIVLIKPRSARGVTDADVPSSDPWQPLAQLNLQAIRENRVAIIDDPEGLLPSTSMIRVGERLRHVVKSLSAP